METPTLTLGHSPDADDAFMFYGLAQGLVPSPGYRFEHILQDIQTLNERARRGELDISAISFHAYPFVRQHYALLPCGASMGDGYGPILVASRPWSKSEVARRKIAVPGELTSAFLALQLWLDMPARELDYVVVPFDRVFESVRSGQVEVGLVIHEGQLTYAREGLVVCQDLGNWWAAQNQGLPLPLGGNVIHKRWPPQTRRAAAHLIRASIRYALDHRSAAVEYALRFARDLDGELADRFVGMYVNDWTLDYGQSGRESIRRFLGQAHQRGLIAEPPEVDFVE